MRRLTRFFGRTAAIATKEVFHISRDRFAIGQAFAMPLLLLVLFGFAVSFDIDEINMAVIDRDGTPASRRLVQAYSGTGLFVVREVLHDEREVEPLFRRGVVKLALVIPPGFERAASRGQNPTAQVLLDGADSTTAQTALAYAMGVVQADNERALREQTGTDTLPLRVRVQAFFNPALRSAIFVVPGVIALVLTTIATLLTALTIAREWERGNVEQLFSTPVGRLEIILGKLAPYLIMGLLQVLTLLTLGAWIFDVPVRGSLVPIFAAATVFLGAMLAQGVLIGTLTKHQQVATQVGMISTLIPSMLLSGFIFPIDNMPPPLQVISSIIPARYFIDALRAVLLKGGGFAEIWHDLLAMGAFAFLLTALAARKFHRRIG